MGLYWPSEPTVEYLPLSQSKQYLPTHEKTVVFRQQHSPNSSPRESK